VRKFKLGLNPESPNPHKLFLADYVDRSTIQIPPTQPLDLTVAPLVVQNPWLVGGMVLNGPDPLAVAVLMAVFGLDQATAQAIAATGLGCCFWAAAVRRAALAAASVGRLLWTSYADMLKAALLGYTSAGWDPKNSTPSDLGTDPTQGFAFLKDTGLWCSDGSYDKGGIALAVNWKDPGEMQIAYQLTGGLMIGVQFPGAWEDADLWDVTTSPIEGGHEIPAISDVKILPDGSIEIDSWGTKRVITAAALTANCNQMTVVVAPDAFGPNGKSVQGFDSEQMLADAQAEVSQGA
jgi:hypothetical protein